jgi:hypothetical protein
MPFKLTPAPSMQMDRSCIELMILANFVEVYLAKEGHTGLVGINYLEKVQLPTLPSLLGAMLGGADVINHIRKSCCTGDSFSRERSLIGNSPDFCVDC